MLTTIILKAKRFFTTSSGDTIIDLISSTFDFTKSGGAVEGYIRVKEEETMRPDLIAIRMYSDQQYYESLLKYNGISNPFSINYNDILLAPPFKDLEAMVVPPKIIGEKGVVKTCLLYTSDAADE